MLYRSECDNSKKTVKVSDVRDIESYHDPDVSKV
jgi:hypothetical protein